MLWFLATTIIWHTGGTGYKELVSVVRAYDQVTCELAAKNVRENYRKKEPLATISVECLPVRKIVVS